MLQPKGNGHKTKLLLILQPLAGFVVFNTSKWSRFVLFWDAFRAQTFEKEPSAFILYNSELWSIDIFKQKTSHIFNSINYYSYSLIPFFRYVPSKNPFSLLPNWALGTTNWISEKCSRATSAKEPKRPRLSMVPRVGGSVELTTRHEVWMHSINIYIYINANIMCIYIYMHIWWFGRLVIIMMYSSNILPTERFTYHTKTGTLLS